jgi:hypothetical protein
MTTEAGGPTFEVRYPPGHDPESCDECKREREREVAMQNDRPILNTRNHVDDPALD